MSIYHTPDEYNFRLHHCRPRFKGNVENVLIFMASEITKIGSCPADEFNAKLNDAIRCFPGNATLVRKTVNNWRTEISSLFGLFYEDDDHYNHACLRAEELAKTGAVDDLILNLFIAQTIITLQEYDFEHQYHIELRTACLRLAVFLYKDVLQLRTEHLKVHKDSKLL